MTNPNPEYLTAHLRTLALAAHPAGGLPDAELVQRYARTADQAAFEVLVWRHGPMVWSTCRRVLRHHQDAEDAFQATFLALARLASSDRPGCALASWLHRVAFNAALKLKQKRRPAMLIEDTLVVSGPDPCAAELGFVVDEEVQRLPDHYRVVFVLSCLEGMTNAEVAHALGCPVGTVDSRLHAARTRLRQRLARRGFAPGSLGSVAAAVAVPSALVTRAVELGTTAALAPPGIDQLATELGRTMITPTRTLAIAGFLGLGIVAATVWALARAAVPPGDPSHPVPAVADDPPAGQPDPPALVAHIGSPEFRHPQYASLLGTSADGKWLYTSEAPPLYQGAMYLYVWDIATGRLQAKHDIVAGTNAGSAIGFGPDGARLVEQDPSGQFRLRIIDPDTGKTVRTGERWSMTFNDNITGSTYESYAFSPDALWLVRSERAGYRLIDTRTGKQTLIDLAKRGAVASSVDGTYGFTPDGRLFYTPVETSIRFHELPTGKHLGNVPDAGDEQHPAGLTPDGKQLLLWVRHAQLWSLDAYDIAAKTRRTILDKRSQRGRVHCASSGDRFAVAPAPFWSPHPVGDWEIRDFASGKELGRVLATGYGSVLFSRDGATLFTTPGENIVVPWDIATGKPTAAAPHLLGPIERFRFTPDGKVVGLAGGFVYTWDAKTTKELARERVPRLIERDGAVTFDPTGSRLHLTGLGDKLVAWDFSGGTVRESTMDLQRPANTRIEHWFTPDGTRHVEYRYGAGLLILRDPATARETGRIALGGEWKQSSDVFGLTLSADGRRVAIGGDNTHAKLDPSGQLPPSLVGVMNVDGSGKPVLVTAAGRVSALAISPDGRYLVAAHRENPVPELGVWMSHTGRRIATIALGKEPTRINAVRFCPAGRMLAVSLGDHEVLLVETASWRVRAKVTTKTRDSNVYFGIDRNRDVLAWSPDGQRLATAAVDGGLMLWAVRQLARVSPITDAAGLERAWAALTNGDGEAVFHAIRSLAEVPQRALPLLRSKVVPVPNPDGEQIKAMLAALDSNDFAQRERATADLAKLGPVVEPALREVRRTTTSAEVRQRIDGLLDRLAGAEPTSEEVLGVRAVEIAEWAATPEALKLLESWASGAATARLTTEAAAALTRLKNR
jgi:RNA polymerase sigma factor (sigma-70 family)